MIKEIEAVQLLIRAGEIERSTRPFNWHEKADIIILLAEKIKAERQTASMLGNIY
jgi:hypothetical protein